MFKILKRFLFKDSISSFLKEVNDAIIDKKMVMSYTIEGDKISFFFILSDNILFFTKSKELKIQTKKIKLQDIYSQDLQILKIIEQSKGVGEIVDSENAIYFVFNFISNIKEQFSLTIFEQKEIVSSIINNKIFFENNHIIVLPIDRYNWVD